MTTGSITQTHADTPVRGTQLLVEHISDAFRRPSLLVIEIGWRWLFGIPFLLICRRQMQQILAAHSLEASGWNLVSLQNPWISSVQLTNVFAYFQQPVLAVLHWLLPAAAFVWVVVSGFGRSQLLMRIEPRNAASAMPRTKFRPFAMMVFQAGWLAVLGLTYWGWFSSMQWVAATHISEAGGPDLVGYFIWAIFLSLGFFSVFALISWPFTVAPFIALLEERPAFSALGQSLRLGKAFTGKLAEINLVMGIVKLALLVLAMVLSSAPVPFAAEVGPGALHAALAVSAVFYLVANDFFQVVRLKAFLEFWKLFRGIESTSTAGN
jgi:hypothetical protein